MSIISQLEKAENLKGFLEENKKLVTVLVFNANWSDECKLMNEIIQELAKDVKNQNSVRFMMIEAEEHENVTTSYGVEAVPSFVFVKNNEVQSKLSGADPTEFRKKLSHYIQMPVQSTASTGNSEADLNSRLKQLINKSPVTLFMKGTPQEPRCGFSRQVTEILNKQDCTFGYFDILSDNEVREGLKKYSNWPTYPQLYIKGELVGGLDIIKELIENGEFQAMLPDKAETLNEKLKRLINSSKIMLFMKGNANTPKCGFSRQTIEILNGIGLKYDTFDILTDEEVRQGLKEYSKWPTYPQLYVDGELVGGLDIIKEMKENGELETALKGK